MQSPPSPAKLALGAFIALVLILAFYWSGKKVVSAITGVPPSEIEKLTDKPGFTPGKPFYTLVEQALIPLDYTELAKQAGANPGKTFLWKGVKVIPYYIVA